METVACQPSLSLRFPGKECWNGLPFPSPCDPSDSESERVSCAGRQILYNWATRKAPLLLLLQCVLSHTHTHTHTHTEWQELQKTGQVWGKGHNTKTPGWALPGEWNLDWELSYTTEYLRSTTNVYRREGNVRSCHAHGSRQKFKMCVFFLENTNIIIGHNFWHLFFIYFSENVHQIPNSE